jgi:YbbR domain-containing protein
MKLPGFLTRNLKLKLSCLFISVIVWAGVVYASNPPEIQTVLVPVPQEPNAIPARYVLVSQVPDLSLTIAGGRSQLGAWSPALLSVSVDWAVVKRAGTQAVPVTIVNRDPSIDVINPPNTIQADLDSFVSVQAPLSILTTKTPPPGYQRVSEAVSPSTVAIAGPQHQLVGVQARVLVDLSDQKTNYQAELPVYIYAANGVRLDDEVTPSTAIVTISISSVLSTRAVAVNPGATLVGKVGSGFYISGITSNPTTVVLSGPEDLLNSLEAVDTASVSLSGVTRNLLVVVRVTPPAGVTADPISVTIRVQVSALPPPPTPPPTPTPTPLPTPTPIPT